MISLLLFFGLLFIDFFAYAFLHQWLLSTVLVCLVIEISRPWGQRPTFIFYWLLGALLIEDFAMHGRFGLALGVIILLLFVLKKLKYSLLHATWFLVTMSIVVFCLLESLVDFYAINSTQSLLLVTIMKIFINLGIGYMVLLGTRDNRSLSMYVAKGRKVWTPSRKDAS